MVVGTFIFTSIYQAVNGSFNVSFTASAVTQLLAAIAAYAVVCFITESRVWPHEIALKRLGGLLKGMLLGVLLVSLSIGVLAILGNYTITGFNSDYSPWMDLLTLGVVAAISEEIMLRGILFRLVEEGLGSWGAVLISALVFGFMHILNPDASLWGAIAISIEAGILFAGLYIITRSLWWCIGMHFAWNMTLGPVFGSIVSGTGAQESWLVSHWSGSDLLTGGIFGLEASIIPVILLGALGIFLLIYAHISGLMTAPIWVRKQTLSGSTSGDQA
jgi:membrane protease YdiL (CAAX protease family)